MSLSCACSFCVRCFTKCKTICSNDPATDDSNDHSPSIPRSYTTVPLYRIFANDCFHLGQFSVHPDARKLSLITEQQTLFYSATLLSPKAPVPTPSNRRASSLFSFSSSPSLSNSKLEKDQSCIDFIIFYDIQSCSFTVKLLSARNLPPKNSDGLVNSYVILYLLPHKEEVLRSKICEKELNPTYYEIFVFNHIPYNEICTRTLVLRVFNSKNTRHNAELLGNVVLPLRKAELHGVRVSAVLNQLQDIGDSTVYGDIQVTLQYLKADTCNKVIGVIIKAANLRKMDYFGLSDPYVKIQLFYEGKKKPKIWYSKTVKNSLSPVYNQQFSFEIDTNMDIELVSLKIVVKDEDLLGKDDVLGVVNMGSKSDHISGRGHWNDMISTPEARLTRWHSLNSESTIVFKFISNWL